MKIDDIKQQADLTFETMVNIRRHLHQHPELGGQEFETQAYILKFLEENGIACRKIAETGILAWVEGSAPGKVVGFRSDIDALPIREISDKPYRSQNDGVMHACGHDCHTAIQMAVAQFFQQHSSEFSGTLKFFFEPAEESFGGAKPMVAEGCMENPHVDYVLGLHVMPHQPAGIVEFKHGLLNASTNTVTITVHGKSGHGAYPHLGIDAIVVAAQIVLGLQTIVSRGVSPLDSAVISIGSIHGGSTANVICDEVQLKATLRAPSPELEQFLFQRIEEVANGIAAAMGTHCEISHATDGYPLLINDDAILDILVETAREAFGDSNISMKQSHSMGGEDFAYFTEHTPGAFYEIGCRVEGREPYALHVADFDVDERCLKIGFVMQISAALKLLGQ